MLVVADNNPTRHIRFAWVNWAIMALCTLIFLIHTPWQPYAFTPAHLHLVGGPKAPGGAPQVIGQMVSYIFLHATWLHLLGNMVVLWVFGDNIEDSMGHWRYALFFVLCGMAGAGAEALFAVDPAVPVIGASGAIAGVMAAYLLLHPRARVVVLVAFKVPVMVPAGLFVGLSITLDVVATLSPAQGEVTVAFLAHIGGFLAGIALLLVLRRRDVPLFQPPPATAATGALALGRFLPQFGLESAGESRLWFWTKTAVFFLVVTVAVEWVLA